MGRGDEGGEGEAVTMKTAWDVMGPRLSTVSRSPFQGGGSREGRGRARLEGRGRLRLGKRGRGWVGGMIGGDGRGSVERKAICNFSPQARVGTT